MRTGKPFNQWYRSLENVPAITIAGRLRLLAAIMRMFTLVEPLQYWINVNRFYILHLKRIPNAL